MDDRPLASNPPGVDYRAIFQGGQVLYLIMLPDSPRFTIVGASDIYLQATRRSLESIVGSGIFEAFPPNPEDLESNSEGSVRASLERVLKSRIPDVMPVQKYDIPRPPSEGGGYLVKYWSPTHFPIFGDAGRLIHIAQRVEDVTEFVRIQNLGSEQSKIAAELAQRSGQMELEIRLRAQEIKQASNKLSLANEELGRRGKELGTLYEQLKALDQLKTEFFANISHEFRTPLTLMLGPLEDLLSVEEPSPRRESLETIHRNSLRLLKLVNTLLDFSRLEAGQGSLRCQPTDLAALTTHLASTFQSTIERAGLGFLVDCVSTRQPVYVDRSHWEKILFNLLSNAFKFTRKGRIAVRQRPVGDRIELSVEDSGCGIPESELANVFKRFYRMEGAEGRSHEGTGIGLALVEELVKLHGGALRVASTLGQGTTFTVSIPQGKSHLADDQIEVERAQDEGRIGAAVFVEEALRWIPETVAAGGVAKQEEPRAGSNHRRSRKRIVVADDNADMRNYVGKLLSGDYEVFAVNDGRMALDAARAHPPDLLLCDVMMPRMDGLQLLQELRSDPILRTLPVILLSARAGEEQRTSGIAVGADDYLTKPFSSKELMARVRTQLRLAEIRHEARADAVASEQRYRQLTEAAQDAIVVADEAGRITLFNAAARRIFGYEEREVLGQPISMLMPIELREAHLRGLARYVATRQGHVVGRVVELRGLRKSGEVFPIDIALSALDLPEGLSFMAALRDTSERQRMQNRIARSEKLASLGMMSAGLAHEINNPLAYVDNNLAVIERDLRGMKRVVTAYRRADGALAAFAPEAAAAVKSESEAIDLDYVEANLEGILQSTRRGVKRVANIVQNLRAFARLDRAAVDRVNLHEALDSSLEMIQDRLDRRHVRVERRYGPLPPTACAVAQLNQVFLNLLVNALQSIETAGRTDGHIVIATRAMGDEAVVEIADNGAGIPPDLLARIFDPFFTTKRLGEGTGLGLSITHGIVEDHHGRIEVESTLGQGALFRVVLPIVQGGAS